MQATQMVLLEGLKTYNSSFTGLLSLTGVDGSSAITRTSQHVFLQSSC